MKKSKQNYFTKFFENNLKILNTILKILGKASEV